VLKFIVTELVNHWSMRTLSVLTGNDIAIAIEAYLTTHRLHISGPRTVNVNAL